MDFEKLRLGDVIKIDESVVKLACQFGSRNPPCTSEHYLLSKVGRKYYHLSGLGEYSANSLWRRGNKVEIQLFHAVMALKNGMLSVLIKEDRDVILNKVLSIHLKHFNKMDGQKVISVDHSRVKEEIKTITDLMCKIDIDSPELTKALLIL